jgi:hypothetical protein
MAAWPGLSPTFVVYWGSEMENARPPETAKPSAPDSRHSTTTPNAMRARDRGFRISPRQRRALNALLQRPMTVLELQQVIGCRNVPDCIFRLRRRGLSIPCAERTVRDRDGRPCRIGVYSLTDADRRNAHDWLSGGCR